MLLTESVALHGSREEEQDENPGGQAGSFTHTLLFRSAFPNLAGKAQIALLKGLFLASKN